MLTIKNQPDPVLRNMSAGLRLMCGLIPVSECVSFHFCECSVIELEQKQ